jgi:hypothetical protein
VAGGTERCVLRFNSRNTSGSFSEWPQTY